MFAGCAGDVCSLSLAIFVRFANDVCAPRVIRQRRWQPPAGDCRAAKTAARNDNPLKPHYHPASRIFILYPLSFYRDYLPLALHFLIKPFPYIKPVRQVFPFAPIGIDLLCFRVARLRVRKIFLRDKLAEDAVYR